MDVTQIDINQISQTSTAVVAILGPFLPFLVETGKESIKKLSEVIAEKGGEVVFDKAKSLWSKVTSWFPSAPKLETAANSLASDPDDEDFQHKLAKELGIYLQNHPDSLQEILKFFGSGESIQHVIADKGSFVENIKQSIISQGQSSQLVFAHDKSIIKGVTQIKN